MLGRKTPAELQGIRSEAQRAARADVDDQKRHAHRAMLATEWRTRALERERDKVRALEEEEELEFALALERARARDRELAREAFRTRLVGQGSYGCVYMPTVNCRGEPDPNPDLVMKVLGQKGPWLSEALQQQRIREWDPAGQFTVTASETCEVPVARLPASMHHQLSECGAFRDRRTGVFDAATAMAYIIRMPNGGADLYKVTKQNLSDQFIGNIVRGAASVFQWLKVCYHKNIAHFDIKLDNIVVGSDGMWRLIDFGLNSKFETYVNAMGTASSYQPLDMDLYHSYVTTSPSPKLFEKFTGHHFAKISKHVMRSSRKPEWDKYLLSLWPDEELDIEMLKSFRQDGPRPRPANYKSAIDVYMFGKSLLVFILLTCCSRARPSEESAEFGKRFVKAVAKPMLAANPYTRVNAIEAAATFERFMRSEGMTVSTGDRYGNNVAVGAGSGASATGGGRDARLRLTPGRRRAAPKRRRSAPPRKQLSRPTPAATRRKKTRRRKTTKAS